MTREELIRNLKYTIKKHENDKVPTFGTNISIMCKNILDYLEQEPSDDVMQGLDEDIRCAMCTNSMKSDSGCDGGCIVNEGMYKKVMETINNHIFSQPTSEDCVSREQALKELKESAEHHANDSREEVLLRRDRDIIRALPPVTPTHIETVTEFADRCRECGKQKTKWIPVSEKLPENKTYVLTTIKVPNRIVHTRSGWYEGGFFHNDNGDVWRATDREVIAWMPLPEPYKAESEG